MKKSSMTGKEIRELRLDHNLTQKQCAKFVGVGLRQWQKYEQGHPCKELYIEVLELIIKYPELKDIRPMISGFGYLSKA